MSDNAARIAELKAKLAASLKYPDGPPMFGYKDRVAAIRAELGKLGG